MTPLMIGTSGYSYQDWREVFYPPDLPKGKMLDFYAQHFPAVEINSSYYRIPHPAVFHQMEKKTPPGFEFVVKVNQETTHVRPSNDEALRRMIDAVQPLRDADKFSGFLAQFPYSFKNTPENRKYLHQLAGTAREYAVFIEFRNWTWDRPEVFDFLADNNLNYVNVDQPRLRGLLRPQDVVSGQLGYVRFHGRNSQNWWKGTNETRYNYSYSNAELSDWMIHISRILKKAYKAYIFFNNHPQGKAIGNANMLKAMLNRRQDIM